MNRLAFLRSALGFLCEHTPQSSARLTGISLVFAACVVAVGALVFAFKHPHEYQTIASLAAIVTALGGSGWATINSRERTGGTPAPGAGDS